ncbi:MAG TPA: metalloregulator ArsR/SmtB family transcription factor [Puia sp.]|nr:metalloregulator ArsR/SmtB family transcription factor [Puia sp.]
MNLRRDVFQAIADPTRRAILALIAIHSMTPNAIADHFDSSRQTISKHLQILTECRLLKQELSGREIYYHFNPARMKVAADWIEQFRELWEGRMNHMEKVLKNMKNKK